jgi:hypothetical protein
VQGALLGTGIIQRPDLGAQQIGAQKIVRDGKPARGIAIEQMKT